MGRQLLGSPPPALDFVVPASRLWRLRLAHALARDKRRLPLLCIPRPCAFASWAPRPSKCERPPPVSATPPWLYLLDPRGPRTGRAGHVCVCLSGPLQLVPRPYEFTSKTHALRARTARVAMPPRPSTIYFDRSCAFPRAPRASPNIFVRYCIKEDLGIKHLIIK